MRVAQSTRNAPKIKSLLGVSVSVEERDYRIIDKRVKLEEEAGEGKEVKEEAPPQEREVEGPSDVWELLTAFIGLLSEMAWRKMGLLVDPKSGKIEKDMVQAKVAIDTVGFIIEKLEGRLQDQEMRELRTLLSNLQLNFVARSEG